MFFIKDVLKKFAIFTRKYKCWSLFLIRASGLQTFNFIKRDLNTGVFSEYISKFLGTAFL